MAHIERIRGRKRVAIRAAVLSANPLCVMCLAKKPQRVTAATEVDHILALVNGGTETDGNRQGLCKACHRDKTAADLGHRVKRQIGADGWPIEG
jgi:5-methylcytosine-specific restriction protein A